MWNNFINYLKNLPDYFISSLIVMAVISVICIIIGLRVKKLKIGDKPGKILSLVIMSVDSFNKFIKENIGKHWKYVAPFALTLGIYIFCANISGMFGLTTPTSYTAITLALALFSVITVQTTGIVSKRAKHVKTLFEPLWPLFPLNLLSDLTPLISMTLRLFGSTASGGLLLGLVYGLTGWFAPPFAMLLNVFFDIALGFIQTLVFVLLTVLFSSNKVYESDILEYTEEGVNLNA